MASYEEALERARIEYNSLDAKQWTRRAMLERVFPELIEDEDEANRNALIRFLEDFITIDITRKNVDLHGLAMLSGWLKGKPSLVSTLKRVGISVTKEGTTWAIRGGRKEDELCGFGPTVEDALVAFIGNGISRCSITPCPYPFTEKDAFYLDKLHAVINESGYEDYLKSALLDFISKHYHPAVARFVPSGEQLEAFRTVMSFYHEKHIVLDKSLKDTEHLYAELKKLHDGKIEGTGTEH